MRIVILPSTEATLQLVSFSASLGSEINEFLQAEKFAGQFPSAQQADARHPGLLKRMLKYLVGKDYDAKLIVCSKYKHPISLDAAEKVQEQTAMQLKHAVLVVGQMVIDVCRQRLGSGYDVPLSYPRILLAKNWGHTEDVTKLAMMSREQVRRMLNQAKLHYHTMGEDPSKSEAA